MKKPYITLEEALAAREEGRRSIKFLTEDNGCINGCCSGVTICSETEFNPEPGFHDDQEGFFVLEGNGFSGFIVESDQIYFAAGLMGSRYGGCNV